MEPLVVSLTTIVTMNVYSKDLQLNCYHLQIFRCFFLPGHKYASVIQKRIVRNEGNLQSHTEQKRTQKILLQDFQQLVWCCDLLKFHQQNIWRPRLRRGSFTWSRRHVLFLEKIYMATVHWGTTCYLIGLQYFPENQVQQNAQIGLLLSPAALRIVHAPMPPRIIK